MKKTTRQYLAAAFGMTLVFALPGLAHPQQAPGQDPAIENQPAGSDEPSMDELLGLDEEADDPQAEADKEQAGADPQLSRELDKALTGAQAADQFAQAIEEMGEVAIRLGEESDAGIDTQRMQDEIILKLEQIIASAEKTQSQQQQQQGQGQPQGQPRQADRQQGQQPGEQQGQQPGQQQQGQQPGQEQGQQPGDQQGQGEQPGQTPSDQQANGEGGQQSGQSGSRGSVRNEELSMQDLREGEWGNLPPRLRDELAESLSEQFNPVYRAATEAFYRRIAELSQQQAQEGGDE